MATNTKGKIIIVAGITLVVITASTIIASALKKKKIRNKIYDALNDKTSVAGQQAVMDREDKHKANLGFNETFWRDGKNGILPDTNYLTPNMYAREKARAIANAIWNHGVFGIAEDEDKVMRIIKQHKSQGQLSQTAYAYGQAKLGNLEGNWGDMGNGDLGEDIKTALRGTWYGSEDYLDALNGYIESLPY